MVYDTPQQASADNDPAAIVATMYRLLGRRGAGLLEHSTRTGHLSRLLGLQVGLHATQLQQLQWAGDLHDVGKIDIPDAILLKPSSLDPDEWRQMQAHSAMGEHLLVAMGMRPEHPIVTAVRHHHESYDGSGYPDGLHGDDIPFFARVISIADSYDAIANARAYHDARSPAEVLRIMKSQRHQYDPALLEVFLDLMHREPEAGLVESGIAVGHLRHAD
ncbi:HD-GYP domain-containing protein [Frateuria aurantia]